MKPLRVEAPAGAEVQIVRLHGNPKNPEPVSLRVALPFGDVEITRCSDGTYWVHVRVDSDEDVRGESSDVAGAFQDARIDVRGKHASECAAGDFGHPDAYHVAVRIGPKS
jgi:hypothetical protein